VLRVAAPAWRLTEADETLAESLAARLKLRPTVARILVARGFLTVEAIGKFLGPRLGELRPPAGMADLDVVLTRIQAALSERQKVGVFGDYDVDGVTSAAVLTLGLRAFGAEICQEKLPGAEARHLVRRGQRRRRLEPSAAHEKRVRAGASGKTRCLEVEEQHLAVGAAEQFESRPRRKTVGNRYATVTIAR